MAKAAAPPARGPATDKRGTSSAARDTEPPSPPPAKADPSSQLGKGKMQQPMTRVKMHLQRHEIWLRLLLIMVRGTTIQLHLYPLRVREKTRLRSDVGA
jgi:hypothetical protein